MCETRNPGEVVGLMPFIFNEDQTHLLIFGDGYIWVIKDGLLQSTATKQVSTITRTAACLVTTAVAHGLVNGAVIKISVAQGMTQINDRLLKVANATTTTFTLKEMDGTTDFDSTGFDAYTTGAFVVPIYELESPYEEADLENLTYAQSGDIISIACRGFAPRELSRTADTAWALDLVVFNNVYAPRAFAGTPSVGTETLKYKIAAVYDKSAYAKEGKESLPGTVAAKGISNIAIAVDGTITVTIASHGYSDGDQLLLDGIAGTTELNLREFIVTNATTNTFDLQGIDGTDYTAYTSSGYAAKTTLVVTLALAPTPDDPVVLTWTETSTGLASPVSVPTQYYNIYKESNGQFNFIATTPLLTFSDIGITSTSIDTPYEYRELFFDADNWPRFVSYYQGRLGYAGSEENPDTAWLSVIGDYHNFSVHNPPRDADAVTIPLGSNTVNEVRAMVGTRKLIILTANASWVIKGDSNSVVTPEAINAVSDDETGAAAIRPVVTGNRILYVQAHGAKIRDLGFDFNVDGYTGGDLTVYSAELFSGHQIVSMAFQRTPTPILWAVRDDGILLSMTYSKEEKFFGWTWHDTDGLFENVAVIPEGDFDSVYLTVNRDDVRSVERLNSRLIDATGDDLEDKVFMDQATSYDGWDQPSTYTVTLTGADFTAGHNLTCTGSHAIFEQADADDRNAIFVRDEDGTVISCVIVAYTSTTIATVRPTTNVPAALQATATSDWAMAVTHMRGLWDKEGKAVSVIGDSFVIASPWNADYDTLTVADGEIELPEPRAVVHVGLPYYSDLETLPIDTAQSETLMDKKILISSVTVFGEQSRGGFVGSDPPEDDDTDPLEFLDELFVRGDQDLGEVPELVTGDVTVPIQSQWKSGGSVFFRGVDPLPLKFLAIGSSGYLPYRRGGE